MTLHYSKVILAGAAMALVAGQAFAQQSTNRVSVKTDWSVFVEREATGSGGFAGCWGVTAPKNTVNTRDGATVSVRRGDIRLMVFYTLQDQGAGQVTFTGGYPFAPGSTAELNVDGTQYEMSTDGELAWPTTPGQEPAIIAAMKRGAEAVITARSSRGTITRDTFSLSGFTAAADEAKRQCAS